MAYEIIGTVHKIGATENIATKSGGTLQRRSIVLNQRRFDQNTDEEFEPNFPSIDFTNRLCTELDKFKPGDKVRVRFNISGVKYNDRQTQEEKYFTSLRGFRIEIYVAPQPQPQAPLMQVPQPQYPPQQPYQAQTAYPGQQPYYPPQQGQVPGQKDGLPF